MIKNFLLTSDQIISLSFRNFGINTFIDATRYVLELDYGRNTINNDINFVLSERKGTCSTKHALLKKLCNENGIEDIHLVVGIYLMTGQNTEGVGEVLRNYRLGGIPEAHCYLTYKGERFDFTGLSGNEPIEEFLYEEMIEPEQIGEYKKSIHLDFISKWLISENIVKSTDDIWRIREECISALST